MAKTLVLAEKPSVGRELARVLGCRRNGNGCLIGDKYIVTWALGHLVTLADPEHYGKEYQKWDLKNLPMLPKKMDLEVIGQTSKQYKAVKALLHDKEVSSLVIATDAGREGELVARWIVSKAGFSKPMKRLWISSQTDKAIRDGFANLKDAKEYDSLYQAAQARAEADWLVGLNVTRALTCKFNAQLSAGRVQTPTLALIVAREEEIRKFRPKEYYNINADLGKFFVTWHDAKNQTAVFDEDKARELCSKITNGIFKVESVKRTPKSVSVPMLYDLTELQRDANKKYGYSAKQTLNIMQSLYERHKALTYPRTDSRYLTDDIIPTLTDRLRAVSAGEMGAMAKDIIANKKPIAKACVNNAKVSDHHAIIPTEQRIDLLKLSNDERRIYLLVVQRFLACFYPPYRYESVRAELVCDGERFYAIGRRITDGGWRKVYDDSYDEEEQDSDVKEQALPDITEGASFKCVNTQLKKGRTRAPARYTEATLLSAMENPSKFIESKKMKEYIGGGLGTPATRADIIEKLFSSFYVERHGNEIVPTSKGEQVIKLAPEDLREPLLTAKWEQRLDAISKGKENRGEFIGEIKSYATELVKDVISSEAAYVHDNVTRRPCPECGKMLLAVNGKKGKMLVCQDRECGYRENVSMITNARCPVCHKKMEMYGSGDKKSFVCVCGYRENEEAFIKRTKGSANAASKSYAREYMRRQNSKEEQGESAFAKALREAMEKKK
jgi:DNA topoisomerase-3